MAACNPGKNATIFTPRDGVVYILALQQIIFIADSPTLEKRSVFRVEQVS